VIKAELHPRERMLASPEDADQDANRYQDSDHPTRTKSGRTVTDGRRRANAS
jgi:hypothetical protein